MPLFGMGESSWGRKTGGLSHNAQAARSFRFTPSVTVATGHSESMHYYEP